MNSKFLLGALTIGGLCGFAALCIVLITLAKSGPFATHSIQYTAFSPPSATGEIRVVEKAVETLQLNSKPENQSAATFGDAFACDNQGELDLKFYKLMESTKKGDTIADNQLRAYRRYREERGEEPFQYLDAAEKREHDKVSLQQLAFFTTMFSGPENFEKAFPEAKRQGMADSFAWFSDAAAQKMATANMMLVAHMTGHSVDEIEPQWDLVRTSYARQALGWSGEGVIADAEFYGLAGITLTAFDSIADYGKLKIEIPKNIINLAVSDPSALAPHLTNTSEHDLKERIDKLEAALGILLSDPEIRKTFNLRKDQVALLSEQKASPTETADIIAHADNLYKALKEFEKDPERFKEEIKQMHPDAQRGWQLLLEDFRNKQKESR